jgi:hypothetical protein
MTTDQPHVHTMLTGMTPQAFTMSARRSRGQTAAAVLLVAVLGGCTSPSPVPPSSPPTSAATPDRAALEAYARFWRVVDAAGAAPRAENWEPQLEGVASGQALTTALTDVRNYVSLPAHTVGTISRTPTVAAATPQRVSILDCVDIGATQLVSDKDGTRLDDPANRVQRFQLRSDVVATPDGRWVVDTTAPNLDRPC